MTTTEFEVISGNVDSAIEIMRETAKWLLETGKPMWKLEDLTKDKLLRNLKPSNFIIGKVDNDYAASMILQWHDSLFWPEIKEDESGFIHKLCVRRKYAHL